MNGGKLQNVIIQHGHGSGIELNQRLEPTCAPLVHLWPTGKDSNRFNDSTHNLQGHAPSKNYNLH